MATNYTDLKGEIKAQIKPNGVGAITGQVLQDAMLNLVGATEAEMSALNAATDEKLAQLDQELQALKARVAALEGNEEPEEPEKPEEPDVPTQNRTMLATAFNGKMVATLNGEQVQLPYVAKEGDAISLEVVADEDHEFVKWSDNNTDNPRIITMEKDVTLYSTCELVTEETSDYELLKAIYSTQGKSYINSQEAIDSTSKWDLYFGQYGNASNGSQLRPLFGIRRTSGTGDAYANGFYYQMVSSWKPYAWVFGGTDNGAIEGSGYGVPFNGNMHKLSQRGKDIYEWDRHIYHIEKDFTNPDNVPAFIGSLAKTASETYNINESNIIFYRFVTLDENDNITKDLRPAKRKSDGKLGAYDVVNNTFTEVVGTWKEYTNSEDASIRIVTRVAFGNPATSATLQGANLYKGYWISVHDQQRQFAVVKDKLTYDGTSLLYPKQQLLTCAEYNAAWHGNASWLSEKKWDESDFFPLLYVSTDKHNELLCVYRIIGSNPDALEGIELVQKISTPRTVPWYFNNYYGMAGVNTIIHAGYIKNSWSDSADNTIMVRVLPLPNPKIGNVVIAENEALTDDINIGFGVALGDGYWTGKYFNTLFSAPTYNEGRYVIYEIDGSQLTLYPVYSLNGIHTQANQNYLTELELEGIKFSPFDGKWSLCSEPTNSGRLNTLLYSPLANYIEVKTW